MTVYIIMNENAVAVQATNDADIAKVGNYITRHDITAESAQTYANQITEATGELHIAVDNGASTMPRYEVERAPAVGDVVSKGFNGDYYYCGVIAKISKTLKVITLDNGTKFYKNGDRARWIQAGGTWSLVQGVHNEQNPSF